MEWRHEVAQELTEKQRRLFHAIGARVQSIKSRDRLYDADAAHELALWALDQTGWKSQKAAMSLLHATRKI